MHTQFYTIIYWYLNAVHVTVCVVWAVKSTCHTKIYCIHDCIDMHNYHPWVKNFALSKVITDTSIVEVQINSRLCLRARWNTCSFCTWYIHVHMYASLTKVLYCPFTCTLSTIKTINKKYLSYGILSLTIMYFWLHFRIPINRNIT